MIQYLTTNYNSINQESYDLEVSSLSVHNFSWPCCERSGHCSAHGSYFRSVLINGVPVTLKVKRVRCSCSTTHAILPTSVIPYKRILLYNFIHMYLLGKQEGIESVLSQYSSIDEFHIRKVIRLIKGKLYHFIMKSSIDESDEIDTLIELSFLQQRIQFLQFGRCKNTLYINST